MRRREFITLFSGAAAFPLAARAQQSGGMRRVGVLSAGGTAEQHARNPRFRAFYEGMRELSWAEGVNLTYVRRYTEGWSERLPPLAQELVGLKPDVIVTASAPPALALKAATRTVPIVMLDPGDPVACGLVASLNQPGGNVTGVSSMAPALAGKRVEILRNAAHSATRVAMLFDIAIPPLEVALKEMTDAAARLGVELLSAPVAGPEGFDQTFAAIQQERANGLIVIASPLVHSHQDMIVGFAAERRLPTLYANREFVEGGGLLSYGPNYPGMFRRGAFYVDRILKGAKPSDLPVEQPTKFELVINLKTAKALGLTISPELLARADDVIE